MFRVLYFTVVILAATSKYVFADDYQAERFDPKFVKKICEQITTSKLQRVRGLGLSNSKLRPKFWYDTTVSGQSIIIVKGFKDGCPRIIFSDEMIVKSLKHTVKSAYDLPPFLHQPAVENWFEENSKANAINLSDFVVVTSAGNEASARWFYTLIFGETGLVAGSAIVSKDSRNKTIEVFEK